MINRRNTPESDRLHNKTNPSGGKTNTLSQRSNRLRLIRIMYHPLLSWKFPMLRARFAPSPTGYLHIGSARTFIFNWLYVRRNQGTMILRIDDTDLERNTQESLDSIFDGLKWLDLGWDE